jgi:hypothetical protein
MIECALAKGARDAAVRSRDVGSQRSSQRIAMITKVFFMPKDIYLIGAKILRDHGTDQSLPLGSAVRGPPGPTSAKRHCRMITKTFFLRSADVLRT